MFRPFRFHSPKPPSSTTTTSPSNEMGSQEQDFGLRLKHDGTWQHHPKFENLASEAEEPSLGSDFDSLSPSPLKPLRRLTNFALYDSDGRLAPLEILSLAGVGDMTAFGTLLGSSSLNEEQDNAVEPYPIMPPFPLQEDQIASLVLLAPQPSTSLVPIPQYEPDTTAQDLTTNNEMEDEVKILLEQLPFAPITSKALLETEIGKRIQRTIALDQRRFGQLSRLAGLVKQAWRDLLEQGGSEPESVNPEFLSQCSTKLDAFLQQVPSADTQVPPTAPTPVFAEVAAPPVTTAASAAVVEESVDFENLKRLKRVRKVDSSELVPEYEYTGVRVEPEGPHQDKLLEMITFLKQLGKKDSELIGWRLVVSRKTNLSHGEYDYTVFISPDGVRFRSRTEVGRAFKSETNAPTAAAANSKTPVKAAAPTTATAATANNGALLATRPPFECYFSPPTSLLLPQPAEKDVKMHDNDVARQFRQRVRLTPIGWSFTKTHLYLHTRLAVYELGMPSDFYRAFYCNAYLLFTACRLIPQAINSSTSGKQPNFNQIVAYILMHAEPCPGLDNDKNNELLVCPEHARAFFYYPAEYKLTFDFIVSHEPQITHICGSSEMDAFFTELKQEHLLRKQRAHRFMQYALQLEEERKQTLQKRATQNEAKQKDRIGLLARRIELETDLPDDYLVERLPMSELVKSTSQDPLMHLALEKVLAKVLPVRNNRPAGMRIVDDPAHYSGYVADIPPPPQQHDVAAAVQTNRALFSGSIKEALAFNTPDQFGETLCRFLHAWEGACLFAKCTPTLREESLVSFRKQVYGHADPASTSEVFATMLRAVARDEFARLAQPAILDDVPNVGAEVLGEAFSAYDRTVWPLPQFAINAKTWPLALRAALVHYIQTNPDACMLEAFECGEWSGECSSKQGGSNDTAALLVDVAKPKLDFLALCDDGLRRLLAEQDSEGFFKADPTISTGVDGVDVVMETEPQQLDLGMIRTRIATGHYSSQQQQQPPYELTMPRQEMLECLVTFRQGIHVLEKKPDCGKCKTCLEKPRFGGINLLRSQVCLVRQQAEQSAFAGGQGGGGASAVAVRNQLKAKKRTLDAQVEEKIVKWDEAFYLRDGVGGGHEAVAADVRRVFRACKNNHKGNSPLLKAAAKLEGLFFAFYYRFVVCRDEAYVGENRQVLQLPENMLRDEANYVEQQQQQQVVPPRVRQGFPSVLQCVAAMSKSGEEDFMMLDDKVKLVALGWLVDRALDCVSPEVFTPAVELDVAIAVTSGTKPPAGYTPLYLGLTRDYCRVWATPRMVKETGGLILVEDMKSGQWTALHSQSQLEEFVSSLDSRGRRECLLKRHLDANIDSIKQTMTQCLKELSAAPTQFKTAEQDLAKASKELKMLQNETLPKVRVAAEIAREQRIAKHDADEMERKKQVDRARGMWKEAKNADGKPYYYHSDKRPPVWDRPEEMDAQYVAQPFNDSDEACTREELEYNSLKRQIEQLESTVELCESRLLFSKTLLQRDRCVLLGEEGLTFKKSAKPGTMIPVGEREPKGKAIYDLQISLLCDMLYLESAALGPEAESFLGANAEWHDMDSAERKQWLHAVKKQARSWSLVSVKYLLVELFQVFIVADSVLFSKPLSALGVELQREEWRWTCSVKQANTLAELAYSLAHLNRLVSPAIKPVTVAWEAKMRRELMEQ